MRLPYLPSFCWIDRMANFSLCFRWLGSFVAGGSGPLLSFPSESLDPPLHAGSSGTWITIVCAIGASFPYHRPHTWSHFAWTVRVSTDRSGRTCRPYHGSKRSSKGHEIGVGQENASPPSIGGDRTDRDRPFDERFLPPSPHLVLDVLRFRYARIALFGSTKSDGCDRSS